jgi:hypothetical protein
MKYTIGMAAKATGKAKSTISRDVRNGTISAEKNDDGSFSIDASELIRVYPDAFDPNRSENTISNDTQPHKSVIETGGLQAELEGLRERLRLIDTERERERRQLSDQIEDLRRRLDTEGEERRKLTAILTDQRKAKIAQQETSLPVPIVQAAEPTQNPAAAQTPMQQQAGLWSRLRATFARK